MSSGDEVGAATTLGGAGVEVMNLPFLLAGVLVLIFESESESESSEEVSAFRFSPAFGVAVGTTLAAGSSSEDDSFSAAGLAFTAGFFTVGLVSSSSEESESSDEDSFLATADFAATGFLTTAGLAGSSSESESSEDDSF